MYICTEYAHIDPPNNLNVDKYGSPMEGFGKKKQKHLADSSLKGFAPWCTCQMPPLKGNLSNSDGLQRPPTQRTMA